MKSVLLLLLAILLVPGAQADPLKVDGPRLEGRHKLLHPIVLIHGATSKGSQLQIGMFNFGDYFRGIKSYYEATGTPVYVVELSTDGSIGERSAVLKNFLDTDLKGQMVNLVGHSLGGLDARYVVSVLNSTQVASVTTIGTPHHGSPVADWAVRQSKRGSLWYWFFRLLGYDMDLRRFLPEITTDSMEKVFNPRVPNRADVRYNSVISSASFGENSMSYILWFPARWLEGEKHILSAHGHDGLVPKDSQKWGNVIADVTLDHLGQMNHHEMRAHTQQETSLRVYAQIYDTLLSQGL